MAILYIFLMVTRNNDYLYKSLYPSYFYQPSVKVQLLLQELLSHDQMMWTGKCSEQSRFVKSFNVISYIDIPPLPRKKVKE